MAIVRPLPAANRTAATIAFTILILVGWAMLRRAPQSSRPKMPAEGLIVVPSDFDPEQTMNRLEAEVRARGMTVFARIDHSAGARSVVRPLRPAAAAGATGAAPNRFRLTAHVTSPCCCVF